MGVKNISELTLEQRIWLNAFLESNHSQQQYDEVHSMLDRLQFIQEEQKKVENRHTQLNASSSFFDKSKCADIYKTVKVDGANMYEQRSLRVMLKYKIDKIIVERQLQKINTLLSLGNLIDIFYIKGILLKKALIKKQFVLNVEHNLEVFIPNELSCDMYPYSFRYYDPIIQITN